MIALSLSQASQGWFIFRYERTQAIDALEKGLGVDTLVMGEISFLADCPDIFFANLLCPAREADPTQTSLNRPCSEDSFARFSLDNVDIVATWIFQSDPIGAIIRERSL